MADICRQPEDLSVGGGKDFEAAHSQAADFFDVMAALKKWNVKTFPEVSTSLWYAVTNVPLAKARTVLHHEGQDFQFCSGLTDCMAVPSGT